MAPDTVTVAANASHVNIPVTIRDDLVTEGEETVVLTLTDGVDHDLGGVKVHTLTIADNDGDAMLAAQVRTWAGETWRGNGSVTRWRRVLKALGETDTDLAGLEPMTFGEALTLAVTDAAQRARWGRVATLLEKLEAERVRVSITAATTDPVMEGETLTFTLRADAAPAADLRVAVTVEDTQARAGSQGASDFVADGVMEVVIRAGRTQASFTVATVDDGENEPGGFVSARVNGGLGDMEFFEGSLAVRSRISLSNTREALHHGDRAQISGLLEKAEMPKSLRPAFMAAIQVAGETEYDGEEGDRERFRRRLIERIITNFEDPDAAMGDENIEYLMAKPAQIDSGVSYASH